MIKDILTPFLRATLYTKGDSLSIDTTLFTIDILIKYLQETTIRAHLSLLLFLANSYL